MFSIHPYHLFEHHPWLFFFRSFHSTQIVSLLQLSFPNLTPLHLPHHTTFPFVAKFHLFYSPCCTCMSAIKFLQRLLKFCDKIFKNHNKSFHKNIYIILCWSFYRCNFKFFHPVLLSVFWPDPDTNVCLTFPWHLFWPDLDTTVYRASYMSSTFVLVWPWHHCLLCILPVLNICSGLTLTPLFTVYLTCPWPEFWSLTLTPRITSCLTCFVFSDPIGSSFIDRQFCEAVLDVVLSPECEGQASL